MAEGVREADVALADVLVVGAEVVAEAPLDGTVDSVAGGGGAYLDIDVIRGAAEHAVRPVGHDFEGMAAADQVLVAPWDEICEGGVVAGRRRTERHSLAQVWLMLQVIEIGRASCRERV